VSKSSEPRDLLRDDFPRVGLHEFGGGELVLEVEAIEICLSKVEVVVGVVIGRVVI